MVDHEQDPDDPGAAATGLDPHRDEDASPASGSVDQPVPDRRAFLDHLSRDAVSTAGRVAGLSSVFRRSVFAAGEAMMGALAPESATDAEREATAGATATAPRPAPVPVLPTPPAEPVPAALPTRIPSDPVAALTPEQHTILASGPTIVLAANDPAGPPHVTVSAYHWDGSTFSLPAQQFTLRASNVESDPRVSLFLEVPGTAVAMTGVATVVYGDAVADVMLRILVRDADAGTAQARWEELRASGDRMIISVRPTRFVWLRR